MPIPKEPLNLLTRPFADAGAYSVIPDETGVHGRASLRQGFPVETQRPLEQGGVAPNRTDFNGIFHMLSAAMFWQQSGGQWTYKTSLNYAVPALVFHAGKLWWCVKENGPESVNGLKTPGTDNLYWVEFLEALLVQTPMASGNPVGTVISYWGTIAPEGYFACDGSTFSASAYPQLFAILGGTTLPDLRGRFIRGLDNGAGNDTDTTRRIGSIQEDTFQNFTGFVPNASRWPQPAGGPFYYVEDGKGSRVDYAGARATGSYHFDPSRVARTSSETRPKNMALLYCIKHDD